MTAEVRLFMARQNEGAAKGGLMHNRSTPSETQHLITLHRQLRKPLGIDELRILSLQICV